MFVIGLVLLISTLTYVKVIFNPFGKHARAIAHFWAYTPVPSWWRS